MCLPVLPVRFDILVAPGDVVFRPCGAWPSLVVLGWTASLLAYVMRPVVPLGISWVPSVGVIVVVIIVTTIMVLPIILIVAMVVVVAVIVVVAAIVIPSAIVILTTVVVIAPVVVFAVVIVLPIAVVISISVVGTGSLGISRSWSRSSS